MEEIRHIYFFITQIGNRTKKLKVLGSLLGDLEMEGLGGIGGLTLAEIFSSISSPE